MARLGKPAHKAFADLLAKAEKEGWGYHDMIVRAARLMANLGVPPEDAIDLMEQAAEKVTRRPLGKGEVHNAVGYVYQNQGTIRPYDQAKTGTRVQPALIEEFASKGSVKDLRELSDPIPKDACEILSDLYSPDSLLHLSPHHCQPRDIKTCEEWIKDGVSDRQYICPAHLKDRELGRCQANVLYRHYIVYESDRPGLGGEWDRQAGIIARLKQSLPLRLVVWSGNKSLHSWFDCSTRRKDQVQDFISLCVQLGADPACLRPAQLVRMPFGIRSDNQKLQKVIYYGRR